MRSQVDVLTCTFLVLVSLLWSTGIAALRHHKHSQFYAFSFLPLQVFPYPFWACILLPPTSKTFLHIHSTRAVTPPLIIQLTRAETVIYLDNSPWHKSLHIPNMASSNLFRLLICDTNHYTYGIWQSSNLRINLSMTWTIICTCMEAQWSTWAV